MKPTKNQAEPRDPTSPERRAFTVQSVMAMLAGVTITISGCGDDSPTSPSPGNGRTGNVSVNHGHTAVVTSAQLMTGNAVALNIRGSATHPHTVELSAPRSTRSARGSACRRRPPPTTRPTPAFTATS